MSSAPLLIAVIDADSACLDLLCAVLADEGYRTIACATSQEARHMLDSARPDLIILETWLETEQAGWALLDFLRLGGAPQALPILVCSADTGELRTQAQLLLEYRCAVLDKPFDLDVLLAKVEACLHSETLARPCLDPGQT